MLAARGLDGWSLTLALTVMAVSLTLNGFWLAQLLGSGADPARAQDPPTFASTAVVSAPALSLATTTFVMPSSPKDATPDAHGRKTPTRAKARHTAPSSHTTKVSVTKRSVHHPKRGATSGSAPHGPTKSAAVAAVRTLHWKRIAGATYYNVVLWRNGTRVLDLWPTTQTISLPTTSVNHGSKARLAPGRYLWFVYPGFGAQSARHYGALASSGVIVIQQQGGK